MLLKSKFLRIISIFTIILSLGVFIFADTIQLKDGSVIKGKIISFENGQFVVVIGEGSRQRQMRFFADEIASIKFEGEAVPAYTNSSPTANVPASTVGSSSPKKPSYSQTNDGETTVITVGSAPRTNQPATTSSNVPTSANRTDSNPVPTNSSTVNNPRPISIKVKVLADNTANGWTNAGWVVRKGQRIRIIGNGRISLGNGRYSGPRGISTLPDAGKLIKDEPTGSLIAVVGDDNNDFIAIGDETEFIAERDGALLLGINEGILDDNSGSYEVTVEISPSIGN